MFWRSVMHLLIAYFFQFSKLPTAKGTQSIEALYSQPSERKHIPVKNANIESEAKKDLYQRIHAIFTH